MDAAPETPQRPQSRSREITVLGLIVDDDVVWPSLERDVGLEVLRFDPESEVRLATHEVQRLVDQLELTLDTPERRLLHQLRLAAESLGGLRTALVGSARRR
jgi:hypothetical protein